MTNNENEITWKDIPEELKGIIFNYLPPTTLVWLNKEYYIKHHEVVSDILHESAGRCRKNLNNVCNYSGWC